MRPLADIMRPATIDEVVGQHHIIGENKILNRIIKSGNIPNMIFYGPSGIGKTTVANIIAKNTNKEFYKLNATTASIADIKEIINSVDTLFNSNGILLYLDEIQYFNKKQQQTLLDFIETGKITLIASTTENPYFYVFNAILSRSTIFEFKPVSSEDILKVVERAFIKIGEEYNADINVSDEIKEYISMSCGGDVRKAINTVELCTIDYIAGQSKREISLEDIKILSQRSSNRYDRDGDVHYNILSALQKSIRGSDENAALHYLARLLDSGDLISPCRRLLVIASEDIGLSYPQAGVIVKSLVDSALQLGLPEARIPLANATVFLATCPKSNSVICAIDAALSDVKNGNFSDIPAHLKDSHYEGAKKLGHGNEYIYPHGYPNNYVRQQYLPDEISDRVYYKHGNNKYEQSTKKYWEEIKSDEKKG